jgi:hypothetical protein
MVWGNNSPDPYIKLLRKHNNYVISIMTIVDRRTGLPARNLSGNALRTATRNARFSNLVKGTLKWAPRYTKFAGGIGTASQAWTLGKPIRHWQRKQFSKLFNKKTMAYPTPPSSRKRGRSFSFGNLGRGKRLRFSKPGKKMRRTKYRKQRRTPRGKHVVHNSSYNLPIKVIYKKDKGIKYIQATKQKYLLKYNGAFSGSALKGN